MESKQHKDYYSISEVADDCKVPMSTIRFWIKTEIGTIIGNIDRDSQNRRLFSEKQRNLLIEVSKLRHFDGYTIDGLVRLLKLRN